MKLHQRGWGDGSVGKNVSCTIVEIWDQILNSCVISHARPPVCLSPTVVAGESLRLAHQPSNSRFLTHSVISQSSGWDTPSAHPDTRWGELAKIHATGYHGGFYIGLKNVVNFRFVRITTYLWLTGLSWTWVPWSHYVISKTTWWTSPPAWFCTYCDSWNGLLQSTTAPDRVATRY